MISRLRVAVAAGAIALLSLGAAAPALAAKPLNFVVGTSGADFLVGTQHPDIIFGLGGNDRIVGRRGNDILRGGAGKDRLFASGEKSGVDIVRGGLGDADICFVDSYDLVFACEVVIVR